MQHGDPVGISIPSEEIEASLRRELDQIRNLSAYPFSFIVREQIEALDRYARSNGEDINHVVQYQPPYRAGEVLNSQPNFRRIPQGYQAFQEQRMGGRFGQEVETVWVIRR